jgi:hypothetical protein
MNTSIMYIKFSDPDRWDSGPDTIPGLHLPWNIGRRRRLRQVLERKP